MSFERLETVWQDSRYALRTMRKKPAFAATAIATLALAIGGNTAMFTIIRAVLLKPLQYRDPDRLVRLSGGATPARFAEMKAAAHSFTELAAFTGAENVALSTAAEPEVLQCIRVSAGFLRIPGVKPLLGRSFRPEEDSPGGAPVAMISAELWQRRFAGDPQIAGKTATLAATPYTIIGVLPPHFQFPFSDVDVWLTAPSEWPAMPARSRALSPFLSVFGRLQPGVSLAQADAELRVIRRQYAMAHPAMLDARPKTPVEVTTIKDDLVAKVRSMLWMLFGAAGFVLLIACGNVASLLLARATFRSREFAVRSALGAARTRLIGQLLVESLLLSFAGGALGALLAAWSLRAIPHITAFELPRAGEIHMDWIVLGFTAALSIATGVIFGLAPALGASRPDDLTVTLRASGEAAGKGVPRRILGSVNVRGLLVVGQIALSIVLLIGSALLVESIAQMRRVDLGFNPANLLTMRVSLPPSRYGTDRKKASFFEELVQRTESLPGVRGATAALFLPMMGYAGTPVQDAGKPPLKLNERLIATILTVTPEYFRTLGIPLRRGRVFAEQDTADAQRVAIIDEALARRFWPAYPDGQNPVGQRLLIGGVNLKSAEIVGIVANVHQNIEKSVWPESVYVAFAQNPQPFAMLAIRTTGDPLRFTRAVREQVLALDRDQPVADVRTMDYLVEAQVGERRLLMVLLGAFAGVALLLALIGIYGVISYSVAQRTQEVGIRRALGAQPSDILWLITGQGLVLALAGIALGLGGAFALTRVIETLLFHVSATDPATFAGIALFFLVVALAASYIPARRAAGIDPMAALRV
ncbi:MAG: ABC transporter permease [Bryobacteraceae bacterium]